MNTDYLVYLFKLTKPAQVQKERLLFPIYLQLPLFQHGRQIKFEMSLLTLRKQLHCQFNILNKQFKIRQTIRMGLYHQTNKHMNSMLFQLAPAILLENGNNFSISLPVLNC